MEADISHRDILLQWQRRSKKQVGSLWELESRKINKWKDSPPGLSRRSRVYQLLDSAPRKPPWCYWKPPGFMIICYSSKQNRTSIVFWISPVMVSIHFKVINTTVAKPSTGFDLRSYFRTYLMCMCMFVCVRRCCQFIFLETLFMLYKIFLVYL